MEIFAQTKKELDSFFHDKVHIAGISKNENARYMTGKSKSYEFSQWETVNLIDLYYNSKFESGVMDSEGQRKIFMNICKFRADVASKQIDLDVKDFVFYPEDATSEWGATFLSREFKQWAKENYFGELINICVENFPRYGWIVLKEVAGHLEFVPLQTLRNQQDAKSLAEATFVIIEHKEMSLDDMNAMKGWNTENINLPNGKRTTVYERYGFVSLAQYKKANGETVEDGDDDVMVDCLTIMTIDAAPKKIDGNILFMEKITERPFVEAHWATQHGRLMGIGEIENQFENQIGSNLSFNLYRRQLLWSSKKVFQSPDDNIARNLVKDVKDGDVLKISPNGNITQVDMGNRAAGDFANFSGILEKNSDQKSFTYEVATGASLPSGTPFRLGVVLSNAVNSHFDLKREKLGLLLKRAMQELVLPNFKKEFSREHLISMFSDEEGFGTLKDIVTKLEINSRIKEHLLNGEMPNVDTIKADIEEQMSKKNYLFIKIPDSFYKDIKYKIGLTVTGEEIDIPKKIETLTNLYTSLSQRQDPRADFVLARILSYTGENMDMLAGKAAAPQATPVPPISQMPQMMGLQAGAPASKSVKM